LPLPLSSPQTEPAETSPPTFVSRHCASSPCNLPQCLSFSRWPGPTTASAAKNCPGRRPLLPSAQSLHCFASLSQPALVVANHARPLRAAGLERFATGDRSWLVPPAVHLAAARLSRRTDWPDTALSLQPTDCRSGLAALTTEVHGLRFLDLGAGIGSVLHPLARERPDGHFTGVENAPATWLIGRLRTAGLANCDWRWGDIWRTDLAAYNVVYAFLSPAPMAALWEKVRQEMRPGSLFISNSFAVPDVAASNA
jgi:SAM-dependent methyltransferase